MFDAMGQGLAMLFQPIVLLFILGGTVIGIIIGVIPVLGGVLALALLLPFVLGLPPVMGLGFLVALVAVTETGGSITSILLNIPGTGINAATVIDGFPMTQKGQASRAIGAALFSSVTGGVAAAFMAIVMVMVIVPVVLAFKIGDIAMLVLLGLTLLATLAQGSVTKGLISGFLGMGLSLVGVHLATGTPRFVYGNTYIYGGFELTVVAVGLFGLSALFDVIMRGRKTIAVSGIAKTSMKDTAAGIIDVLRNKWLWLRSLILGYTVGLLPGAGGQVAIWTAYAQAKQTSKHPELFGTGCVEGVIAPETANNAKESGALLTTMAFGVPGSATMAVMMAGLFAVGIIPGPNMIRDHLPMVFTFLWGIALANVVGAAICFFAASKLARIAYVPIDYLFPAIAMMIFIGSYSVSLNMLTLFTAIFFGILGVIMSRLGYSRPAFILGFVLGGIFESNLTLAIQLQGPFFWTTPISLVMIFLIVLMFAWPSIQRSRARRTSDGGVA